MADTLLQETNQEVPTIVSPTQSTSNVPIKSDMIDSCGTSVPNESEPSLVPCTPELERQTSSSQKMVRKVGSLSEPLPEDPLTDLKKNHNAIKVGVSKNNLASSSDGDAFEKAKPEKSTDLICSQPGGSTGQNILAQNPSFQFTNESAKIVTKKGQSFLQVVRPVGILVPKNNDGNLASMQRSIKVWTGDLVTPLSLSGTDFNLNLEPIDVPKNETDAVVPEKGEPGAFTKIDESAPSGAKEKTKAASSQEEGSSGADSMRYYRFMNLDKRLIVKATKLRLNGEECFLIPAKLALKHNLKKVVTSKPYEPSKVMVPKDLPIHQNILSPSCDGIGVQENISCIGSERIRKEAPRLRIASIFRNSSKHCNLNGNFQHGGIDVAQKGYHWHTDAKVPFNTSPYGCMRQLDMQHQTQETGRGTHMVDHDDYHPSIRCHKVVQPENAMIRISKLTNITSDNGPGPSQFVTTGRLQAICGTTKPKESLAAKFKGGTKFDGTHALQYVMECSQAGTMLFATGNLNKDANLVEPSLLVGSALRRSTPVKDQVVPDLTSLGGHGRYNLQNDKSAKYRTMCSKTSQEIAALLHEVKHLVGASEEADETQLIVTACDSIMSMEVGIRGLMSDLGYNAVTNRQMSVDKRGTAVEGSPAEVKKSKEAEFLVPQSTSIKKRSREDRNLRGNLPEVPIWDRSASPELEIAKDANWSPSDHHASFSQGRSRGSMPMSSQLSFSESLTDDSENVHEFDLYFEKEASSKEEQGGTFQAFVNDVFNTLDIGGIESCSKASPRTTGQDRSSVNPLSSPERFVFSPSLDHLSFSAQSSPVVETPQTFSVNCLDYDIDNEASPRWYQTVDHGLCNSDLSEFQSMTGNLSMKVMKKRMTKEKKKVDKEKETAKNYFKGNALISEDDQRWIGRSEEDRLAAELLSTLCELDTRKEEHDPAKSAEKEELLGREDEDAKALKHLENIALLTKSSLDNPRTILAKDLVQSDLLASFLYPKPSFIPEDPFGIGAETVIDRSLDISTTKELPLQQESEETPTSSCPGLTQLPSSGGTRKRGSVVDEPISRKRPNRLRYVQSHYDSMASPAKSSHTEENDLEVFIPQMRRRQKGSHGHKKRASVRGRMDQSSRGERKQEYGLSKVKEDGVGKSRTRIAKRMFQRRKALKLVN